MERNTNKQRNNSNSVVDKALVELKNFLKIPSVSPIDTFPGNEVFDFVKAFLLEHKFDKATIIETPFFPTVYAEINRNKKKTLLIYSHGDVQPCHPLSEWKSDPFEPIIKNGNIYARGASDSKGHLIAFIHGLSQAKEIPVNIKVIIDFDEEIEQRSLPWLLEQKKYRELLKSDAIFIAAGAMVAKNTPSVCCGYRGLIALEVKLKTLKQNLHSGTFGGGVPNAASELIDLLSDVKAHIEGEFYSKYRDNDLQRNRQSIQCTNKQFRELTGAKEEFVDWRERISTEPSFEVNGIHSGSSERDFQYIVPAEATAKISARLIKGQDPNDIFKTIKKHFLSLKSYGSSVSLKIVDKAYPSYVEENSKMLSVIEKILKKQFKKDVIRYYEGGCVPIVHDFKRISKDIFMVGFGSPDDNIHGPNEKLNIKDFYREIDFAKCFIEKLDI